MAKEKLQLIISAEDRASKEIKKVNDSLDRTKEKMGAITKVAGIAFIAIGTGVGFAVKEFADFEKGMSTVKAITGATGEDFIRLTDLAKTMGRTTKFTAKEAAEGMKFLGMAGFSTDEIMQSLQGTLNLAAAGNLGLGQAADISSNVLLGFNLDANKMGKVVDVMAKTVTSANTDIIEMGEAMKFLAPTAAALGISIEEASTLVGFLADAGLKGGIATREFSSSLVRLADPTNKMAKGMDLLGLSVFDSNGEFVGMADLLKQVEDGSKGMTDQQKQATISMVFGSGSMKVMNSLLARGSEEFVEFTKELENSGGAADKMAKIQLDNLAGAFTLVKSAISGILIEIGEKFEPMLRFLGEKLILLGDKVSEAGGIFNFFKGILKSVLDFIDEKTFLITIFKNAWDAIVVVFNQELRPALEDLFEAMKPLKPVLKFLAKLLGVVLLGAIIAVVEIITIILIAAIETLKIAVEGITFVFQEWSEFVRNLIDDFNKLKDAITGVGSKIGTAFKNLPANLGFGGGLADGGPVQAGRSFLVGERGPEMFVPNMSGSIIPNNKLSGSRQINLTVSGTFLSEEAAEQMGDLLVNRLVGAGLNI